MSGSGLTVSERGVASNLTTCAGSHPVRTTAQSSTSKRFMTSNGEVEGPAEALGRTPVERSSSGALHSGRRATQAHTLSRARGA